MWWNYFRIWFDVSVTQTPPVILYVYVRVKLRYRFACSEINQISYDTIFYRILHSLAWELIPLPRRFEPAVRPHHRAQRRDNLGATFCQWLHFRRRVVWRSVDASPTWSPLHVGHAPRYIPLLLDNATSLRQFALLCRNHICATLFAGASEGQRGVKVLSLPRHVARRQFPSHQRTVLRLIWRFRELVRGIVRRDGCFDALLVFSDALLGFLFDNIVTCHCCNRTKKGISSPVTSTTVVQDLPCIEK